MMGYRERSTSAYSNAPLILIDQYLFSFGYVIRNAQPQENPAVIASEAQNFKITWISHASAFF